MYREERKGHDPSSRCQCVRENESLGSAQLQLPSYLPFFKDILLQLRVLLMALGGAFVHRQKGDKSLDPTLGKGDTIFVNDMKLLLYSLPWSLLVQG